MAESSENNKLFGHPLGLYYLFFAEMWERFSFYGMRALLILYMTQHLLYDDKMSFGIYAAYGSLVYATPLLGGYLSDKILGFRKSIFIGGILMALGHFVLAIDHDIAFYSSLSLLIIGNGFFKPNISSFVGALYEEGDDKREAGFTIFYMGINIGGWLAPIICGWLGLSYGWHYGFGLAGIGMLVGLVVFASAVRNGVFGDKGKISDKELHDKRYLNIKLGNLIVLLSFLVVPIIALVVKFYQFEHYIVWLVSIGIGTYVIYIYSHASKKEKGHLVVLIYFTLLACLFWAVFEQAGSSLTLYAQRNVDLSFMNASQSNSLNSAYIVFLAIPFSWLWTKLSKVGRNPNSPIKMGFGLVLVGFGFLYFVYSGQFFNEMAKVPMSFLVLGIFIYTIGEMFLSPIGLSKVTELAPKKFLSFFMGIWFLASFYGHFFAGIIAQFTRIKENQTALFTNEFLSNLIDSITGLNYDMMTSKGIEFVQLYNYVSVFSAIGLFTLFVGVLAILVAPFVKRLMGDVK